MKNKEELKDDNVNIQAFDMGFKRSIVNILDANITTLIASIILLYLEQGHKGFCGYIIYWLNNNFILGIFYFRHLISGIVFKNKDKKILI